DASGARVTRQVVTTLAENCGARPPCAAQPKPRAGQSANRGGQRHRRLGRALTGSIAENPAGELVRLRRGAAENDRPAAGHHELGRGLVHLDHPRRVRREPADRRRQTHPHLVAGQDRGSHLQRGPDVLELHTGDDVAGPGEIVAVERDLRIRDLAGDQHGRFAAVLDDREDAGRRLHPSLGAVDTESARRARAPSVGDDDATASVHRVPILCARLAEVEGDFHLLAALGIAEPGPARAESDDEHENSDQGHVLRLAPHLSVAKKLEPWDADWHAAAMSAVRSRVTLVAVLAFAALVVGLPAGRAPLVLASTIGFFAIGHHGQSDVMVTAWTWWALYGLLVARRAGYAALPLVGFYACVAGAIMSKGPMGLLGLVAGFVAVAVADGWRDMVRLRPVLGLAVLVVLMAPWYGTYLVGHGSTFVGDTVVGQYGSWAFRRSALARVESLWVLAYALPWTIFLVGAATWWR